MVAEVSLEKQLLPILKLPDPFRGYADIEWTKLAAGNDPDIVQLDADALFDEQVFLPMLQNPFESTYWSRIESAAAAAEQSIRDLGLETFTMSKEPEIVRPPMPKLTKTQKRMSLGLLDVKKQRASKWDGSLSLRKPPETATSSVNITTSAAIPTVAKHSTFKNTIRDFLDKLRPNHKTSSIKSRRRLSLVDETLPSYIRKQLAERTPETYQPVEEPHKNSSGTSTPGKSRLDNLLANSQSIYANMPQKSSSNVSGSASESRTSEDREYILPGLFTKYMRGLGEPVNEEEEDEDDFITVNATSDEYLFK